jgi:hypothetical protein
MIDFEVHRCTRRCARTDRELRPGEPFVSVLVPDGSAVKRLDYALESWDQPPDGTIAWWKSRMPGGDSKRALWAPHDVMLDYFQRLDGDDRQADLRFLLALLMVRRRILRLEQTERSPSGDEVLVLYCPRNETEYRVLSRMPTESRAAEIQTELSQLLFTPSA